MKSSRNYPVYTVNKHAEGLLVGGHPWVYENDILSSPEAEPENGTLVDVVSTKGAYLGTGFLSLKSKIRVRLISRNANDTFDAAFWKRRVEYAWAYRKTVLEPADLTACRVIFGEADQFPGLTVDRFNNILVTQTLSVGMEKLKPILFPLLAEVLRADGQTIEGIYERNDEALRAKEGLAQNKGWFDLPGETHPDSTQTEICENGVFYHVDFENGQKTGFFLDQKYNRRAVARIAAGHTVLDCFTHTGSFALNAAKGGAARVTAADISAEDIEVANVVASVMKRWAMELGATHYTHWFQPLTGITSEKHDGFVSPVGDGTAIMEFSGKELVRGEPDASSFPSGGLRATCEARGYTAWDPTSYAFVKDDVLCIPTAFVSYTGEALDKKTPLLRSMNALSGQAIRILKLFGKDVDYVSTTVGPEQEYFLVKKEDYEARQDLILTGRTLFGAPSAKGQELEEHYFGVIRPEVSAFMKELDEELWKLGVPAKTKHNEVAPCQHELAPIFDTTNVAIDHNLLTMEMMKKIAPKYGLVCLQHEKPFEGVNGSGKHNNWSMSTTHENLLDPGDTPMENLQFLVFLAAVIKAVDEYADLLRTSVATPGNDHRLGANEAPPAIISIFVGEELEAVIDAIASDSPYAGPVKMKMDLGVDVLPKFSKDTTDRNRTSPFAFTGNKFEFRMPGSAENLSDANTILNTAVAKELKGYADELEGAEDFTSAAIALIKRTIRDHRRVIFNGNGYTAEWEEEAARRGLPNKKNTPAALPALIDPKNIQLMEDFGVLTKIEMESRYEVEMEHYSKIINIEALTMLEMARKQLLPAINAYMSEVANTAASKLAVSEAISVRSETKTLTRLSTDADAMSDAIDALQAAVDTAEAMTDESAKAVSFHDDVLPKMDALRAAADDAETICGEDYWPLPSYSKMLYYV